jgi:3'-phosphoadenosine 5'-phosphosulfate sulfotransferase (PAPS reductase)/FAD synthetase
LPKIDPDELIARAKTEHKPIKTVCLFSGGNDSLVLADRCRDHYDELVFIDTGTSAPGVLDFVRSAAAWLDKPLRIMEHDFDVYEYLVCGGTDPNGKEWHPLGFPGPGQHGRTYTRLKERMLEKMLREIKSGHHRYSRVLALSGIRRAESKRRAEREPITRRFSLVFANPLIDWTNQDVLEYKKGRDLPQSDVAALLHRSGECNCGCYAADGEREMLQSLWPEWFEERIVKLEEKARCAGIERCVWGGNRNEPVEPGGELCSTCDALIEQQEAKQK